MTFQLEYSVFWIFETSFKKYHLHRCIILNSKVQVKRVVWLWQLAWVKMCIKVQCQVKLEVSYAANKKCIPWIFMTVLHIQRMHFYYRQLTCIPCHCSSHDNWITIESERVKLLEKHRYCRVHCHSNKSHLGICSILLTYWINTKPTM